MPHTGAEGLWARTGVKYPANFGKESGLEHSRINIHPDNGYVYLSKFVQEEKIAHYNGKCQDSGAISNKFDLWASITASLPYPDIARDSRIKSMSNITG